jgi:hypothetical protein
MGVAFAQVTASPAPCPGHPTLPDALLDGRDDEDDAGDEADRQAQAAVDWMHARRAPADAAA